MDERTGDSETQRQNESDPGKQIDEERESSCEEDVTSHC